MNSHTKRRSSQTLSQNVNLHCGQCDSQIGIFDNEWIRLTSSYARPKEKGTHFGTEIGQRTQVVPVGVAQKSAEGCVMAEVFCKKCSATLGQYCRSVPSIEKQLLMDQYFYKLSRTYLKDGQTSSRVEPRFGYSGEVARLASMPAVGLQSGTNSGPRWSETPYRQNQPPSSKTGEGFADNQRNSTLEKDENVPDLVQVTRQLQSLQNTVNELKNAISQLQSERTIQGEITLENQEFAGRFHGLIQSTVATQPNAIELQRLRLENESMKARLRSIASAMGNADEEEGGVDESIATSVLGKRKRYSEGLGEPLSRLEAAALDRDINPPSLLNRQQQVPTPGPSGPSHSSSNEASPDHEYSNPIMEVSEPTLEEQSVAEHVEPQDVQDAPAQVTEHILTEGQAMPPADSPANVDFSDEEDFTIDHVNSDAVPNTLDKPSENDHNYPEDDHENLEPQGSDGDEDDEDVDETNVSDTVRPQRTRRRATDSYVDHHTRSMAPEPVPKRKSLAGRFKASKLDNAQISTPESIAQKIRDRGKPKISKRHVQTTEKHLNHELKELGLTEWIGKDKRSAEYRVAVTAARARQREANKMIKLSDKGLNLTEVIPPHLSYPALAWEAAPPLLAPVEFPATVHVDEQSSMNIEVQTRERPQPLSDVTNQQSQRPSIITEKANLNTEKTTTRKQQREEIRKRDQMAKEAMEREMA